MIISGITKALNITADKQVRLALDTVVAVALLAIGCLAVTGVLPIGGTVGWALLGGGAAYTAIMLLSLWNNRSVCR